MIARLVFALAGLTLLLRGAFVLLNTVEPSQWPEIVIWLAAGILLHDLVIAPLTLALGRIVRPGAVLAAGWLATGVALLLTYPLLMGARSRRNPTVIPHDPLANLGIVLVVIVVTALAVRAVRHFRA